MRISDWSSDVCSSDLIGVEHKDPVITLAASRADAPAQPVGNALRPVVQDRRQAGDGEVVETAGPDDGERLPGERAAGDQQRRRRAGAVIGRHDCRLPAMASPDRAGRLVVLALDEVLRSEETTSELQSLMRNAYAGFRLKKK